MMRPDGDRLPRGDDEPDTSNWEEDRFYGSNRVDGEPDTSNWEEDRFYMADEVP